MEGIVNLLTQGSAVIDSFFIARLVALMMGFEFFSLICAYLGGMKR